MARPTKKGVDYFSLDVNIHRNKKLRFIKARFGLKGEAVFFRLLCEIYENGYFLEWDNDIALLFGEGVGDGCTHSFIDDVVSELVKRDFFDENIFSRFSILTSANIQSRYLEATARRKEVNFIKEYLLVEIPESYCKNVIVNINSINANNNEEIYNSGTQSKVDESINEDEEELCARTHKTFSSFFGREPTPAEVDHIVRAANLLELETLLETAIKIAASFGPDSPSSYIVTILTEWNCAYIRTEDELTEYRYLQDCEWGRLKDMSSSKASEKLRKGREKRKLLYKGVG